MLDMNLYIISLPDLDWYLLSWYELVYHLVGQFGLIYFISSLKARSFIFRSSESQQRYVPQILINLSLCQLVLGVPRLSVVDPSIAILVNKISEDRHFYFLCLSTEIRRTLPLNDVSALQKYRYAVWPRPTPDWRSVFLSSTLSPCYTRQ